METENEIKELFEQYLSGQCNAEEITRLYDYFTSETNHSALEDRITNTLSRIDDVPWAVVYRAQLVADRVGIRLREYTADHQPNLKPLMLRWLRHVAAFLVTAAIGWWVYTDQLAQVGDGTSPSNTSVADITPGTNRATLTLANGGAIDLSEMQAGILMGKEISYLDGSAIDLEDNVSEKGKNSLTSNDYILSTPKGGTYQITLSDGSNVWLNAASTLRYPSRFSDEERVVFLEGEAYFEVNKQTSKRRDGTRNSDGKKVPFKVIINGQAIEVLGTVFNIAAYADEAETKTTLVEGRVKVTNLASKNSNLLTPGQQATVRGAYTNIKNVDVDQYVAWKSGRFHFDHTPFDEMIKQVARWYDVGVVYRGDMPKETFSGKMGRDLSLREMLGLMNISDAVIQLEGRTLTVQ